MLNKNFLFIFCMIFLITIISSAPPVTTVQEFAEGFVIVETPHDYLRLNKDYQYNFFVYNNSNGILIDNSSMNCTFFLSNISGEVILKQESDYFSDGHWGNEIGGGNFSDAGEFAYGVSCQDDLGGALSGMFVVTESGIELTKERSILIIGLMIILFLLLSIILYLLFSVESYIGKFALYWVSHVLGILISFVGWQIGVEGLLSGVALTGIFKIIFWVLIVALFPMIILSLAWVFYIHTFNEHFQRLTEKGVDTETAFKMANKKRGGWFNGN